VRSGNERVSRSETVEDEIFSLKSECSARVPGRDPGSRLPSRRGASGKQTSQLRLNSTRMKQERCSTAVDAEDGDEVGLVARVAARHEDECLVAGHD